MLPSSAPDPLQNLLTTDRPIAPLTTWGVGGKAKVFAEPANEADLRAIVGYFASTGGDYRVLGGGSNVLVADGVLEDPILYLGALRERAILHEGAEIFVECGAGTALREIFALSVREGWGGLEHLAGIPGSLGGAIMGNAGTQEGAIGDAIHTVTTVEPDASTRTWQKGDIAWKYRETSLSAAEGRIVSRAVLRLTRSTRENVLQTASAVAHKRQQQPIAAKTAGCVFKNPPGDAAGRLLDAAGCKGLRAGDAAVSETHANFIENYGSSTASDILNLAYICRRKVEEAFGIKLAFEIKTIGIPRNMENDTEWPR